MKLKTLTLITASLLLGACATKYNSVAYMSLEVPNDTIRTTIPFETSTESTSRISVGVYRPPAEVSTMLESGKIYRNSNIILQTPFCVFPIICSGSDRLVEVAQEDMM